MALGGELVVTTQRNEAPFPTKRPYRYVCTLVLAHAPSRSRRSCEIEVDAAIVVAWRRLAAAASGHRGGVNGGPISRRRNGRPLSTLVQWLISSPAVGASSHYDNICHNFPCTSVFYTFAPSTARLIRAWFSSAYILRSIINNHSDRQATEESRAVKLKWIRYFRL
jgi:hypothetical protein